MTLAFFVLAASNLPAQPEVSSVVTLAAFEGTIQIFANNEPLKIKIGMNLAKTAIIRAVGGTALLYFPEESLYGVIKDGAGRPENCLKRAISDSDLVRITNKTANILDVFLASSHPEEATLPKEATLPAAGNSSALTAAANINLVLILDASTSMRNVFPEMQDYVFSLVMEQHLKTGDFLSLFVFGAETAKVYAATLDLPKDRETLRQAIFGIKPSQLATDIGAMLAELQVFITSEKLPNKKTVIIWATDGKNNPFPNSPWAGKDIYQPTAFAAYRIVKSAEYKVLLLSIGTDATAAQSLGGPLGGEVVKLSADAKAGALGSLLAGFAESIELVVPQSISRIAKLDTRISLGFLSTYKEAKTINIERILVSVDGSAKTSIVPENRLVKINAMDQEIAGYKLALPGKLTKGEHVLEIELVTEGNKVMKSLQHVKFTYAPFDYALAISASAGAALILILLIALKRRKHKA